MPIWRPKAEEDLQGIVDFIAEDNPRAAIDIGDMLVLKAGKLDENPEIGRPGRVKGTRELVAHPNYIIIYKKSGGGVEVLRVKHAMQKWPE